MAGVVGCSTEGGPPTRRAVEEGEEGIALDATAAETDAVGADALGEGPLAIAEDGANPSRG